VGWNTVGGLERPINNVPTGRVKGRMEYRNCKYELAGSVYIIQGTHRCPVVDPGHDLLPSRGGEERVVRPNAEIEYLTAMSAPSTTAPTQQVNVSDLELPQLVEVKRQLEEVRSDIPCSSASLELSSPLIQFSARQELSHLTSSFAQLKQAQAKFRSCIESAKEVKRENKGTVLRAICLFYIYARALG
jgi:hypothetical protein